MIAFIVGLLCGIFLAGSIFIIPVEVFFAFVMSSRQGWTNLIVRILRKSLFVIAPMYFAWRWTGGGLWFWVPVVIVGFMGWKNDVRLAVSRQHDASCRSAK